MRKSSLAIALVAALVLSTAGTAALAVLYHREVERNEQLKSQLDILSEKESRSAVMQSINAQMEEIANQERLVSDRQREEAIEQRKVAEAERQNAEEQRRAAEEQRQNAIAAEHKALEASKLEQRQRLFAEQQRTQAEYAKRVADTLTYITISRKLGTLAMSRQTLGDTQLADLLAYAGYRLTSQYGGDVYNPAIYQALSTTSTSSKRWNVGQGAVTKMLQMADKETFVTVSSYGEIALHSKGNDGNLHTENIFRNSRYDFRDLTADNSGTLYALSHTGHLVYGKRGALHILPISEAQKPFLLTHNSNGKLLVVAQQSIHLIDPKTMQQLRTLQLTFKATTARADNRKLVLFDTKGNAYTADENAREVKPKKLPFSPQPITSYTHNETSGYEAYGTMEGRIFIVDGKGNVQTLVGHNSRVSRVKFDGDRLYSTSYDGTVRFWPFTRQKIEPMTIVDSHQWIVSFSFDEDMNYIWTGDQNGNLTETLIDPDIMAGRVHNKLKRELTQQEWEHYVGKEIPYTKLMR